MRLGIAVVYMFNEQSLRLLDLHLESIAKHTAVPYRIFQNVITRSILFAPGVEIRPKDLMFFSEQIPGTLSAR